MLSLPTGQEADSALRFGMTIFGVVAEPNIQRYSKHSGPTTDLARS
jgi:hypothetical protein